MTDIHAGMILAAIQLIVMFGAMRAFYGAWPWEHRKTWYATKIPNQILHEIQQKIEPEPLSPTLTVEIPKPFGIVAGTDTFERPEIPREQIEDAARNP